MSVERIGDHRHRMAAVLDTDEGGGRGGRGTFLRVASRPYPGKCSGKCLCRPFCFIDDGGGTFFQGLADIFVTVGGVALDGDEQGAGRHRAGIAGDGGNVDVQRSAGLHGADVLYEVFQFHFKVSRMVSPFFRGVPAAGDWAVTWPEPSYTHL